MSLQFSKERSAIIHSSWHDPRKVREMTIVGSKRMIVYDDIAGAEKIKIHDVRIERPPHYDTFAAFHYAYHYGDTYSPYIKQDEPLKTECQHFVDCIREDRVPLTSGETGLAVVKILEASSVSLKHNGASVELAPQKRSVRIETLPEAGAFTPPAALALPKGGPREFSAAARGRAGRNGQGAAAKLVGAAAR